jgi:FkbM family methyltransferase
VGDVTVALARTGADVVALEPSPHAFSVLEQRCARLRNVRCLEVAASGDRPVRVEMHDWHTERLTRRGRALRERLTASGCDNVRLDWRQPALFAGSRC